jgi:hypothetical protein
VWAVDLRVTVVIVTVLGVLHATCCIDMPCLGSARLVFDFPAVPVWLSLRRPSSSPRLFHVSYSSYIATPTPRQARPRLFTIMAAHLPNDLFEYTSGRWM